MASLLRNPVSHFITLSLLTISFTNITPTTGEDYGFVKRIDRKSTGLAREKLSHFRLYWHDIVSGRSPTAVRVVQPPPSTNTSSTTGFGMITMIDNPLTVGPKLSSKMVGRAQGFYAFASQEEASLLMVMNFAFIEGKYNGSTFTVLGRNTIFSKVREMAVIGGSGLFRFARGYAQLRTHEFNVTARNAVVKYNVYVMHY